MTQTKNNRLPKPVLKEPKVTLPPYIQRLADAIEDNGGVITVGLQPEQLEIIDLQRSSFNAERNLFESELARIEGREPEKVPDIIFNLFFWEKMGKIISWHPFTLALYYFEQLFKKGKIYTYDEIQSLKSEAFNNGKYGF